MADPFGRAVRDFHRDEQSEPLYAVEGDTRLEHPIEQFYFTGVDEDERVVRWLDGDWSGPLLDVGAGAGRHALYFQEQAETVAIEVSDHLVTTMAKRGVEDARRGDMFALRADFDRDRFGTVLAYGTQVQLAASRGALDRLLSDLAHVTDPDGTALLHGYEPDLVDPDLLGYREVPEPGLAFRTFHFEYEGDVGETLLFRLFGADRLREAVAASDWTVARLDHGPDEDPNQWLALLEKR